MSCKRGASISYRHLRRSFSTSSCKKLPHSHILPPQGKPAVGLISIATAAFVGAAYHQRYISAICEESAEVENDSKVDLDDSGNIELDHCEIIVEADRLYSENKIKELLEYLLPFKNTSNGEILWRLARAHKDRSRMEELSKKEKKALVFEGIKVAKSAVEQNPDNCVCHKWFAMMIDETGSLMGRKWSYMMAVTLRKHLEKVVELCPSDAEAHFFLGQWHVRYCDLYHSDAARLVTNIYEIGDFLQSTKEEALGHYERAEAASPGFSSTNQLMLGSLYMKMGRTEEARVWFEKLSKFPVNDELDQKNVDAAKEQLRVL